MLGRFFLRYFVCNLILFGGQLADMVVEQAVLEAKAQVEIPTKTEVGEGPQTEHAGTSAAAAVPVIIVTMPTTIGNVASGNSHSTGAAPNLHSHASSSVMVISANPNAPPFGRAVERSKSASSAGNFTQNSFGGTPSITGFTQRSHAPPQLGAVSNMTSRHSQPGSNLKNKNQMIAHPSQSQGSILLGNWGGLSVDPSVGSQTVLGSGSQILTCPRSSLILPPGRSGPAGPACMTSYPAGPGNRLPSITHPAANLGAGGQGHVTMDASDSHSFL